MQKSAGRTTRWLCAPVTATCSLALALCVAAFASAAEVEVKLLGGREPVKGELAALGNNVAVVTADGRQALPSKEVLSVNFPAVPPAEKPAAWIEMIDGSKLQAVQITAQEGKARLELIGGTKVEVPTRSIKSLRLKAQDADLARQWRSLGNGVNMAAGDVLVVRKQSQRTVEDDSGDAKTVTETALDQLEGTILAIKPDTIDFDFGGETIPVKREKVEGIFFIAGVKRELPPPTYKLVEAGGSEWSLKSVELREAGVAGVTTSNVSLLVPLDQVAKIDFAAGNIVYLGDVEPDNLALSVGLQPSGMQARFDRLYQSWQNRRFGSSALALGGVRYDKGLGLASRTEVTYRVPEGFKHFRALAGIDDSVEQVGGVTVSIVADGKQVFSKDFTGDDRGPTQIDLDLAGARRISIVVSPIHAQGYGDLVNLCEARLTK
jgi:hypothetical protein